MRWTNLAPRRRLCPQAVLLLAQLRGERLAEVLRLEHGAHFQLGLTFRWLRAAPGPLHRLLHRLDLPDPEPGDQLLRLSEGAVDHARFAAGELDLLALRAGLDTLGCDQDAGLNQLLIVVAHRRQQLG